MQSKDISDLLKFQQDATDAPPRIPHPLRWSMTRAEVVLSTRLQGRQLSGFFFRKQHPVGPYIADFACVKSRVLIEIDGETH
jgi:very-short-patch-repair endonuclease